MVKTPTRTRKAKALPNDHDTPPVPVETVPREAPARVEPVPEVIPPAPPDARVSPPHSSVPRAWGDTVILVCVTLLIGLLPIIFAPFDGIAVGYAKNVLLYGATIVTLALAIVGMISRRVLVLPQGLLFTVLSFLVAVYTLSALTSGSFFNSFFGAGDEVSTGVELVVLAQLMIVCAITFTTKQRIFSALMSIFVSAFVAFVFQSLHIAFPDLVVHAGIPVAKTGTLLGAWSDLGIFAGIVVLLLLVTMERMPRVTRVVPGVLYGLLLVALFFHTLAQYAYSWIIVGSAALVISLFAFLPTPNHRGGVAALVPWLRSPSLLVALFSLGCIFAGAYFNVQLFSTLSIPPLQDVRPSWAGTYHVARALALPLDKEDVLGVGPNRFFVPWQQFLPPEVNKTPWWDIDFTEGVGTIPSSALTTGILGVVGWGVFLLTFLLGGVWMLFRRFRQTDALGQYVLLATFVGALYFFVVSFVNTVGVVPYAYAFIFAGLFGGAVHATGLPRVHTYSYRSDRDKGFAITTILLAVLLCTATVGYYLGGQVVANSQYYQALLAGGRGDSVHAQELLTHAIARYPSDIYYRTLSVYQVLYAQALIARTDMPADTFRAEFSDVYRAAIENANQAIAHDDEQYRNWVALASAYAILAPLNIPDVSSNAYVRANDAYTKATLRNPFSPTLPYLMAKLALSTGAFDEAAVHVARALALKTDYLDAHILAAHIEEGRGNTEGAIRILEDVSASGFGTPDVWYQLGVLRYRAGDTAIAVDLFAQVIREIPEHANAKYFLGLSYVALDRLDEARKEFEDVARLNPDRADVADIIRALEKGEQLPPVTTQEVTPQ